MGKVILETGRIINVSGHNGAVYLSQLISDLEDEQHTASFRIHVIGVIAGLQQYSVVALDSLKKLTENSNPLIVEAAKQAIKRVAEKKDTISGERNFDRRQTPAYPLTNATQPNVKKSEVQKVILTEESFTELHENANIYRKCNFCEKLVSVTDSNQKYSEQLAGHGKFFCNSCIRHDFFSKFNKNVLVLTFRGLFSYYYYCYYIAQKSQPMYFVDIQEFVEMQYKIGMKNPLFVYDPESFCWFIDFSKVGTSKIPIESILETVIQILATFNLYENVRECSPYKVYNKYKQAIEGFYTNRTRVGGDTVFSPTLIDCDIPESGSRYIPEDVLKGFVLANLENITYNNRDKKKF